MNRLRTAASVAPTRAVFMNGSPVVRTPTLAFASSLKARVRRACPASQYVWRSVPEQKPNLATLTTRVPALRRSDTTTVDPPARQGGGRNETAVLKSNEKLVAQEALFELENELSQGEGIRALADFNNALRELTSSNWEAKLMSVFKEWCFNLESFNPAFAAVLLQVQLSVGDSDYDRRDNCLRSLIQPLAGEYGMHNNEPQAKTHRQLFKDFFRSIFPTESFEALFDPEPVHAKLLFAKMIRDIQSHGTDSVERASYALGYNLAIEYLADYEKRWMLQSFRQLSSSVIRRDIDWVFLEIHAEDEKEHAAIGHEAVLSFVPNLHAPLLQKAMQDHDRDFAAFYDQLTGLLRQ